MSCKIGNFIDKVQGYIGCQTVMMKQANDTIKHALPEDVKVLVDSVRNKIYKLRARSSGNTFVSGAGDLRFKSQVGQIGHNVANSSPPLGHFFEGAGLPERNAADMSPVDP